MPEVKPAVGVHEMRDRVTELEMRLKKGDRGRMERDPTEKDLGSNDKADDSNGLRKRV